MAKEHYNSSEGFKEFSFLKITDLCDLPVIAPFQKLNQLCDEIKYSCSLEKKNQQRDMKSLKLFKTDRRCIRSYQPFRHTPSVPKCRSF